MSSNHDNTERGNPCSDEIFAQVQSEYHHVRRMEHDKTNPSPSSNTRLPLYPGGVPDVAFCTKKQLFAYQTPSCQKH